MAELKGNDRARYVQGMFAQIANRYDLMNRLMTFGQDRRWRKKAIERAKLPTKGGILLDLGAGTGDLGMEAYQRVPRTLAMAVDFTIEMMLAGRKRPGTEMLRWTAADALRLPFRDETFAAVVSGFLLRNVIDLPQALQEQYRVIKPGGRIVSLDTTHPKKNLLSPMVRFYMNKVIPFLGQHISGQREAYVYLPNSSERFVSAEQLAIDFIQAGFGAVGFELLNFGTIAIHWGEK
jgi:demethylmenaquinone methyltransferase/2-methoxy-6-polyprenyl-1,4-benzoquinol methylase